LNYKTLISSINFTALIIIHVLFGFFFLEKNIGIAIIHIIFTYSIFHIIFNQNKNNEVILWGMYWIGMEVFMRMTKSYFFYESGKYFVIIIIILGLIFEKKRHPINLVYIFYILLLLIGIAFSEFPNGINPRKEIAASLSGPFLVGISSIYFINREITLNRLIYSLKIGVLPFLSMMVYLYIKTPNFEDITFNASSNFDTVGGFGPNQVSTALGFAIFLLVALFLKRKSFSGLFSIDLFLIFYFFYRALLTFSRGGVITSFIMISIFIVYYYKYDKIKMYRYIPIYLFGALIAIASWIMVMQVTDGMIANRYLNRNAAGVQKEDLLSSREKYIDAEWEIFKENPFLGVGVGSVKFIRNDKYDVEGATHNEISRMLSEHGLIGLILIFVLLIYPILINYRANYLQKAFSFSFLLFWFLTINHSAMRIALPGFVYGLSLITIIDAKRDENSIHR
jgi:hypothetical protein